MKCLFLTILIIGLGSAAEPGGTPTAVVLTLRNGKTVFGIFDGFHNGAYRVIDEKKTQTISLGDIKSLRYYQDSKTADLARRRVAAAQQPTQQELFEMAIKMVKEEREAKKVKLKQGDDDTGIGGVIDSVKESWTEKVQDNLLDVVLQDKEMQNILLDPDIQKMMESGDYFGLMQNEKIMRLMRDKRKVQKLTKPFLDPEEKKEKEEK